MYEMCTWIFYQFFFHFESVFQAPLHNRTVGPGFRIVVMIVSTVANMFPTLSQAILIHVNTLITTPQASPALLSTVQLLPAAMIAVTIPDMYPALFEVVWQIWIKRIMAKQLLTPFATHCTHEFFI